MSAKRAIKDNIEYKERRSKKDHVEFPLMDEKGNYVRNNRRKNEDQRTGILVTRSSISQKEFAEYFEANKKGK
jgi:hypothetical protein